MAHRRGYSSVGRAPALQAGCQRFESAYLQRENLALFGGTNAEKSLSKNLENCIEKKVSRKSVENRQLGQAIKG